jgi:hypothetical protein
MEAFFCTDLQATPEQILQWVVMRWSVEVTFEEGRAHLGLETQRQWSDQAIARTTPVLLGLFSLVTVLALRLSQGGQIPVPVSAWSHTGEPTFSDCLALVRRHQPPPDPRVQVTQRRAYRGNTEARPPPPQPLA